MLGPKSRSEAKYERLRGISEQGCEEAKVQGRWGAEEAGSEGARVLGSEGARVLGSEGEGAKE